jgi:6-phosphogluconate dehydrogenase
MQLICEAYQLLRDGLGVTPDELSEIFKEWNKTELDSYLIEISAEIFAKKDEDGEPLIDKILDAAGQKGTGKWTCNSALDLGMPLTLIGEAVFARCLSALKDARVEASKTLIGPKKPYATDRAAFIEEVRRALYCSKLVSYAQGYMVLREAAREQGWHLNFGGIALMWRGGCIIRSQFLGKIKEAYDKNPELSNLLLAERVSGRLAQGRDSRDRIRCSDAGVLHRAFILRRLPYRTSAGERSAGPARLFWRAHLRARRPAPRQVLPHQLDRTGRQGFFDDV